MAAKELHFNTDARAALKRGVDQLAVPGFVVYADAQHEYDVRSAFMSAGALEATHDSLEAARLEAAYPVFGVDMTSDNIPL